MTAETMPTPKITRETQIEKVNLSQIRLAADPFEVMDQMDDEIILKEIEGRIVDTWVYHFKDDNGREQWGLSKVGVDASCAELAKKGEVIREIDVSYQIDPTDKQYVLFVGKAARYGVARDGKEVLLDTAIGTKRQGLIGFRKDGTSFKNPFWFEQGAMKALRNARGRLISEEIKTKIISFAKKHNKTQELPSSEKPVESRQVPRPPQPLEGEITEPQTKAIFFNINRLGITEEQLKSKFAIEHISKLSKQDASNLISDLNKMKEWPIDIPEK